MSPIIYTPHDCEKPEGNLPAGTLYQCPECDRVWERGTDVFEDDTNLHWWVEEDPRRGVALQKACSQRTQSAPTITPDMVERAARVLNEEDETPGTLSWDNESEMNRRSYRRMARAALDAALGTGEGS